MNNPQPRFVAKWNNGFWKVFDSQRYMDVQIVGLQKEAEEAADARNKGVSVPRWGR